MRPAPRVRVLVIDDHEVVRSGLRWLLRRALWVQSCYATGSPEEALRLARSRAIDVALVDVDLGDDSGLRTCLDLRAVAPATRVALVSSRSDLVPTRLALEVGALGVIAREAPATALLDAVQRLARGLEVDVPCPYPARARLHPLDRELLRLAAAGFTNAEIGSRMHLAAGTVKRRLCALYPRLGVRNRAGAVHATRRLGLVPPVPEEAGESVAPANPASGARVVVADAVDVTRAGLMLALKDEPWVTGCDGVGPLAVDGGDDADVALVGCFDYEQTVAVMRAFPAARIVLICDHESPPIAVLDRLGASGVVLRSWAPARCAAAVRAVWADAAETPGRAGARPEERVSAREREVLGILVTGATNDEIASQLGLSPYTVKQHASSIYRKLGVRNRAEASGLLA
jgi:DNA-binding NarL/FixJ family response regulator